MGYDPRFLPTLQIPLIFLGARKKAKKKGSPDGAKSPFFRGPKKWEKVAKKAKKTLFRDFREKIQKTPSEQADFCEHKSKDRKARR